MSLHVDLDECTARALDDLLTLASAAAAEGRPELALSANAALDELLGFMSRARAFAEPDLQPFPYGVRSHAQH